MVGPVFFFIINTSIKRGFLPAAMSSVGVMLSDAFFILIAYFGSSFLLYLNNHLTSASIIGGIVIMSYGIYLAMSRAKVAATSLEEIPVRTPNAVYVAKGFMLNTVNPAVLLFWIVVASTVPAREEFSRQATLVFYLCTLTTILSTDLLKSYLALKLKQIVTAKFLLWMNRIAGSLLTAYGISMIVRLFMD